IIKSTKYTNHLANKLRRHSTNLLYIVASIAIVIGVWWLLAALIIRNDGLLPTPPAVVEVLIEDISNGSLQRNTLASLRRVSIGYSIGIVTAIPVALPLGWYKHVRGLAEPWIQFFRTIPPIAI